MERRQERRCRSSDHGFCSSGASTMRVACCMRRRKISAGTRWTRTGSNTRSRGLAGPQASRRRTWEASGVVGPSDRADACFDERDVRWVGAEWLSDAHRDARCAPRAWRGRDRPNQNQRQDIDETATSRGRHDRASVVQWSTPQRRRDCAALRHLAQRCVPAHRAASAPRAHRQLRAAARGCARRIHRTWR